MREYASEFAGEYATHPWLVEALLGGGAGLAGLRLYLEAQPAPRPFWEAIFGLGLLLETVILAGAAGRRLLKLLHLDRLWPEAGLDLWLYSQAVGLGLVSLGVLGLGLVGLLTHWALLVGMLLLLALGLPELAGVPEPMTATLNWAFQDKNRKEPFEIVLTCSLAVILVLTVIQALAPPWDYDGLLYHLEGPRHFLEAGRIFAWPQNWLTFYPFTVEMLYTLGMAFGSDNFARLISLWFTQLLALSVYAVGRRQISRTGASLAVAILVGIPILPVWASTTYIDMAWALFEFLGVFAGLRWLETKDRGWLLLAGGMLGLAAGTKYMGLGGVGLLGVWIVCVSIRDGWRKTLVNGAIYAGMALLVGCPWYLKNLAWTGDPLYPLGSSFFTGAGQVELWTGYMRAFGTGSGPLDYLLLPVYLYTQYKRFGTFMGSIEIPSLLFPLMVFYPWVRKRGFWDHLFLLTVLRFGVWALGAQQTRFLLPLYPAASLLVARLLALILGRDRDDAQLDANRPPRLQMLGRVFGLGLPLGMVIVTLVYAVIFLFQVKPEGVILGRETKSAFLKRVVHDYAAVEYIQTALPASARVFMLWDGRGYYCDERCLPDIDHSQWAALVATEKDPVRIAKSLNQAGVTHLLFSLEDVDFLLQHDPGQQHEDAAQFLAHQFIPACADEIYRDDWASVYALTCGGDAAE